MDPQVCRALRGSCRWQYKVHAVDEPAKTPLLFVCLLFPKMIFYVANMYRKVKRNFKNSRIDLLPALNGVTKHAYPENDIFKSSFESRSAKDKAAFVIE